MEAIEKRVTLPIRRMLSTRSGTFMLAAVAAALAGLLLVAFLSQYRDSVRGGTAPQSVLVAGALIPKGTSGDVVIGEQLFTPTTMPTDEVSDEAAVDTAAIAGKVAVRDIYPGQQITTADFGGGADAIRGRLTGDQRAIAVPLEGAQGLVGKLRAGDRVDVFASFAGSGRRGAANDATLRTLLQNVLVLSVPEGAEEGDKADVTLRVNDRQAAALAFAAENGKIWFALRPPVGASGQDPAKVDIDAIAGGGIPANAGGDR